MKLECLSVTVICSFVFTPAFGAEPVENLDSGLSVLSAHAGSLVPEANAPGPHTQIAKVSSEDKDLISGRFDEQDRVLVHVLLDGRTALEQVGLQIESLQGRVLDRNTSYRHGILAAYLPTDQLENVARIVGVRALTMEHEPAKRSGKFSSQSREVLKTDLLNQKGFNGDGITIGVISDSFNTAQYSKRPPRTNAEMDIKAGYLPVVNVLQDFSGPGLPFDEGRAICQVAYAEAPHCNEAFATGNISEVGFANNIVRLRTEANCDVIDDDLGYYDEPVFSDGILSEAVDAVVTSKSLPGKPVIYTSSAGNDGNNGYRSAYRELSDADVRSAGHHGNLKLDVSDPDSPHYLNPALTAGGWHNWNPNGGSEPVTTVTVPAGLLIPTGFSYHLFLQWDDPFDEDHGITNNYNFLIFDADGNFLKAVSGTTNSFKVQQPFQSTGGLRSEVGYQIAFTKTTASDPQAGPPPATHQLAMYTSLGGLSVLTGTYFQPAPLNVPIIYGHPAAASAIGIAAYVFNWKPAPPYQPAIENYTTPGPAYIYFNQFGQRMASPEVRLKPEVAGVDGVITTFFYKPGYYNYPFAFFGTSGSGPTVAGVVALMLQAAGGPGSLSVQQVRSVLETTALPRSDVREMAQARGANHESNVFVSALGSYYFGPNYLTVNFFGPPGEYIESLTIDGSKAGLEFNTTASQFVIGSANGFSKSDVTVESPANASPQFTLLFKKGVFTDGASLTFTVGQDEAGVYRGLTQSEDEVGVDALDLAHGATFTSHLAGHSKETISGEFGAGRLVRGYQQGDGFGLIDAVAAVEAVRKK